MATTAAKSDTPTATKDKAAPTSRPERPNEEEYKAELATAEKELRSAEERLVCKKHPEEASET